MNHPQHSIRRFSAILISGALASKMLGFVREVAMAHVLGATLLADCFRASQTAIWIPLAFLQNESVPAIMIPMHREALDRGDGPRSFGALTIVNGLIATLLMLAILLLGEWWVNAVVGGFSEEGHTLALHFVRLMSLAMPASAILNVLCAGEIALGRTRLTNARASLLNVAVLSGIGLLVLTGDAYILAYSFSLAFNVLACWGLFTLWREGVLSFSGLTFRLIAAKGVEFFKRLRVLLGLPIAEQGNVWVERFLASRLTMGAVASLDYARSLTESALLLISQPVGMAVLSNHPPKDINAQAEALLRPLLALILPASAFLAVFATDIVRLIYFRGAFGEEALALTSHALRGIAFGLWAATLGWVLVRLLNGAGRNGVAALIIVSAYIVNVAFNLLGSVFVGSAEQGMLFLGLGEASRSIVLLLGMVLALGERRKVLALLALASLPALLMAALGLLIEGEFADVVIRLFAGSLTYLVCLGFAIWLLLPSMGQMVLDRVRRTLRVRES